MGPVPGGLAHAKVAVDDVGTDCRVARVPTCGVELQGGLGDGGVGWDGGQVEAQQSGILLLVADLELVIPAVVSVRRVLVDVSILTARVAVASLLQGDGGL